MRIEIDMTSTEFSNLAKNKPNISEIINTMNFPIETNTPTVSKKLSFGNSETVCSKVNKVEKPKFEIIKFNSYKICEQLVCDYPFFKDLIKIESNEKGKTELWIFKKSDELMKIYNQLLETLKKIKSEQEKEKV